VCLYYMSPLFRKRMDEIIKSGVKGFWACLFED
jgi:hypothetical protein